MNIGNVTPEQRTAILGGTLVDINQLAPIDQYDLICTLLGTLHQQRPVSLDHWADGAPFSAETVAYCARITNFEHQIMLLADDSMFMWASIKMLQTYKIASRTATETLSGRVITVMRARAKLLIPGLKRPHRPCRLLGKVADRKAWQAVKRSLDEYSVLYGGWSSDLKVRPLGKERWGYVYAETK